jgi:hypothetical protein
VQETILSDKNTFFMEHVLEESDSKDFFNKYVAGFTIGPLTYTMIGPNITSPTNSSSSNSSIVPKNKTVPILKMPSNPTTVWYSNQVGCIIHSLLRSSHTILCRCDDKYTLAKREKNQFACMCFVFSLSSWIQSISEDQIKASQAPTNVMCIFLRFERCLCVRARRRFLLLKVTGQPLRARLFTYTYFKRLSER